MKYVLTGATGHIGNNVARALAERGEQAVLLSRREKDAALEGLPFSVALGSVEDAEFLKRNIARGDTVLHCAGMIAITERDAQQVRSFNIDSTRVIADVCAQKGARLVYVSSVDAIAPCGETVREPNDFYPEKLSGCYAASKAEASQLVVERAREGKLDGLVVCPSAVVGENDFKVSCVGQVISDYMRGLPMARVDGGYNFVDVRDVASGILLAAEKGASGKSYLLTGEYLSVDGMFEVLNGLLGRKCLPPWLPLWFVRAFAGLGVLYYTVRGKKPVFSRYALDTLETKRVFDCTLTQEEIGYSFRPAAQAVESAARWYMNLYNISPDLRENETAPETE